MRPNSARSTWLIAAGTVVWVAATVVVNQSAIHWRDNLADSHLFAYYGWRVAEGARPYLDAWDNKPPGVFWANALAIRVVGPGAGADLLAAGGALTVSLLAFVALAGSAYPTSIWPLSLLTACVLLAHPYFECGANRTETFVVPCELLAMLGYVRWRRCGRTRWLILCGLAGGAAPWFKQSGAAALAACAVHMAWRGWRDRTRGRGPRALEVGAVPGRLAAVGLVGGASAAAPSLAVLAGLWATGSVGEALFAVGRFNKAYFVTGDATWFAPKAMGVFLPDLAVIAGLLAFAAIGLIAIAAGAVRGHLSRRDPADHTVETAALFLMWFVAALWLAAMAPGRRSHHLMPALPPVGLLALLPFALLAKQRPLAAALIARPSAAVLAVLFVTALGNVGVESLREVNAIWRQKPTWYSTQRIVPRGPQLRARAIRRLAPRARSMYVWGWSPGTYRFALLPCPSRYATIEKVGQVGQPAQFIVEGAVADLRRTPADVFVISTGDYAALAEPADAFGAWLDSEYEDREVVDGMHILVRRSIDQERNEPREGREQNRPPTQTGGQDGRP